MPEPTLYELACGLLELRDRVVALEAAGDVAGNPGHASAAPAGVTIHELTRTLEHIGCDSGHADFLWNDSRIGPLLRGEGAPAQKRVVLPEDPPFWRMPYVEGPGSADAIARAVWAAARAEVERQQGQQDGGQVDG